MIIEVYTCVVMFNKTGYEKFLRMCIMSSGQWLTREKSNTMSSEGKLKGKPTGNN